MIGSPKEIIQKVRWVLLSAEQTLMAKLSIWTARQEYHQVCLNNFVLFYHKLKKHLKYF